MSNCRSSLFFVLAPILFIVSHAYTLVHFVMLAAKTGAYDAALREQLESAPETSDSLRRQLPSNVFVQFLAGPRDIREGGLGWLLKAIAWISLVIGPVLLLLLIQAQFLPYHLEWVTWVQRFAVLVDVILLWLLWPAVLSGRSEIKWPPLWRYPVLTLASLVPFGLAFTAATFPGEAMEDWIGKRQWIPPNAVTAWLGAKDRQDKPIWSSFHDLLFQGEVDEVTGRRTSLFSNTLVLPYFDALEATKIDELKKLDSVKHTLVLRRRHLESAIFDNADLRKADLESAYLQDASLKSAQLERASLKSAQLQRAVLDEAQLQHTALDEARLQGAWFKRAQLQKASLKGAYLQDAALSDAQLQGASLEHAHLECMSLIDEALQGASLESAHLQGANLTVAHLEGASLKHANLWGANLQGAYLQGASLERAELQGAYLGSAHLDAASLDSAGLQGADLAGADLEGASLDYAGLQGASFYFTSLQGATFRGSTLAGTNMNSAWVWRTSFEGNSVGPVFGRFWNEEPEDSLTENPISKDGFASLKADIMKVVPEGEARENALKRIKLVNPDIFGPEARVSETLLKAREDRVVYEKALADEVKKIVCSNRYDALYIVRGLIQPPSDSRIEDAGAQAPGLVNAILKPDCPVSAALTDADRAALKKLAKEAQPSARKQ
jgi:uncharacterized protein YjbI with pentapeptide repeats